METSETSSFAPLIPSQIQECDFFWGKRQAEIISLSCKQVLNSKGGLENTYLWKVLTHENREFYGEVIIPLNISVEMGIKHLATRIKNNVSTALRVPV